MVPATKQLAETVLPALPLVKDRTPSYSPPSETNSLFSDPREQSEKAGSGVGFEREPSDVDSSSSTNGGLGSPYAPPRRPPPQLSQFYPNNFSTGIPGLKLIPLTLPRLLIPNFRARAVRPQPFARTLLHAAGRGTLSPPRMPSFRASPRPPVGLSGLNLAGGLGPKRI